MRKIGSFVSEVPDNVKTRFNEIWDGLSDEECPSVHLEDVYGLRVPAGPPLSDASIACRPRDQPCYQCGSGGSLRLPKSSFGTGLSHPFPGSRLQANDERVFLDALRVKIRDAESRQVKNKAVYVALGVIPEDEREVRGYGLPTPRAHNSDRRS